MCIILLNSTKFNNIKITFWQFEGNTLPLQHKMIDWNNKSFMCLVLNVKAVVILATHTSNEIYSRGNNLIKQTYRLRAIFGWTHRFIIYATFYTVICKSTNCIIYWQWWYLCGWINIKGINVRNVYVLTCHAIEGLSDDLRAIVSVLAYLNVSTYKYHIKPHKRYMLVNTKTQPT